MEVGATRMVDAIINNVEMGAAVAAVTFTCPPPRRRRRHWPCPQVSVQTVPVSVEDVERQDGDRAQVPYEEGHHQDGGRRRRRWRRLRQQLLNITPAGALLRACERQIVRVMLCGMAQCSACAGWRCRQWIG
jgi:hypothetical protein